MMKKKSGGRRAGAGRKATLSFEDRLFIGGVVHARLEKKTQDAFDRSLSAKVPRLKGYWSQVNQFSVASRRRWRSLEDRYGDEASDRAPHLSAIGETIEDIEFEIEEGPLKGERYLRGPLGTAKGLRKKVLLVVSRAMSCRYGFKVSTRMAVRCLVEFRTLQKAPL
jgi:hypothetical protein